MQETASQDVCEEKDERECEICSEAPRSVHYLPLGEFKRSEDKGDKVRFGISKIESDKKACTVDPKTSF